jgi:hypothetical protein
MRGGRILQKIDRFFVRERVFKQSRRLYCLPPGIATCYPRSVNRNIFYIIGVIVVIVLKVLHVF